MVAELKEREVLVGTQLPASERDALQRVAALHERKIAAELRIVIRQHIKANEHLLKAGG